MGGARASDVVTSTVGDVDAIEVEHAVRARVGHWPYEPDVAHLVLLDHQMVPSSAHVASWIEQARAIGCRTIRTGALFPSSIDAFIDAGFDTIDRLALLETRLRETDRFDSAHSANGRRVRLRAMRSRHLAGAATIDRRSFPAPWGNDRAALADILHATPASHATMIDIDRTMSGFAITGVAASVGYLQRLAVDPAAQRHGLGRSLVADSLSWMRRRNATRAMVNTAFDNGAALALYESFGFERLTESLLILELRLDTSM
jgi:ribosomal-protein-alanine N-acetyltransferase